MRRFALFLFVFLFACTLSACAKSPAKRLNNDYTGLETGTETFVRIFKAENELELWLKTPESERFELAEVFSICSWSGSLGPKLKEGDGQSPEGFYQVRLGSLNPNSSYHLSFNLGFPNTYDRAHGRTGSYLMVHGACVSIGCYAMTDIGIEKIYGAVETSLLGGQDAVHVHIFPFRMTAESMLGKTGSDWYDFWVNLKQGYDLFEKNKLVPRVSVQDRRYVFE